MKDPHWILDEDWGVGTDTYNWILYRRGHKKDGSPGSWKPAGYYPDAEQLLKSMAQKITRTERYSTDLAEHIEACYERVTAISQRFSDELVAEVWSGLKRPTKRAA